MRRRTILIMSSVILMVCATPIFGDATKNEWFGDWQMSLDGRPGVLSIHDSKADCASSPWCEVVVTFTDSDGNRRSATIDRIDDHWQHMVFFINFPGNRQKFDAYIFSWDKRKMAGTTYWGGRTFGFSASKP
jgi:hypothetical protein